MHCNYANDNCTSTGMVRRNEHTAQKGLTQITIILITRAHPTMVVHANVCGRRRRRRRRMRHIVYSVYGTK